MDFCEIEKNCNYTFKNRELLKKALTLSSFDNGFNNQSLECLGDALLTFIVAEKYYAENASEGDITEKKRQLLSDEALAPVSKRLGIADALICGKGDTHNKKAIPSAYEAFVAAVYLDGGLEAAKRFALATLTPLEQGKNYVGEVQEILQADGETPPEYRKTVSGTPQKPWLIVEVEVRGRTFKGEGESFDKAKKIAAKAAYEYLQTLR